MRKFLLALNLVCVMFIFGCRSNNIANTDNFKKYELVFTEILNGELWLNSPTEGSYRLHFPNDILPNDLKKKSLFLKGQDNIESVLNFYRSNGINNKGILITIPKIINVKIKFQLIKSQLVQTWYITSFYAEMPNKN
ncbi:hypothetical protein [Spiroplasma endosymbiont of Agriotes lineatus]|uniref:hypothetical protein n=1 Tax=Spiroplasma endosymbiont of Agriotes lineatus TaxID=3077930 RepID=UPI0030CC9322